MSWIRVIDEGDADEALAALYARAGGAPVDNILKIHSLDPAGLDAHLAVYTSAMRGTPTLPKVDRELIAVVVSGVNGCHY